MANSMKVHIYDVRREQSAPLENMISLIAQQSLDRRLRTIGEHEMRLEHHLAPRTPGNPSNFWLLDFTKIRFHHGPGKANRSAPTTGFGMGQDDGFGEESAALYDPAKKVIIVQFNHAGPRANSILSYFNTFDASGTQDYAFPPRMSQDVERKLGGKSILTRFRVKISPPALSAHQRSRGVALGKALDISDHLGGTYVDITVSVGRSRNAKLNFQKTRDAISAALGMVGVDGAIEALEVSGKSSADARAEAIDLLMEKLEQDVDGLILGPDKRYTRDSRWKSLLRAQMGWANLP